MSSRGRESKKEREREREERERERDVFGHCGMYVPRLLTLGLGTENRYQYGTGSNTTGTYPDRNATQISVLHFGA